MVDNSNGTREMQPSAIQEEEAERQGGFVFDGIVVLVCAPVLFNENFFNAGWVVVWDVFRVVRQQKRIRVLMWRKPESITK